METGIQALQPVYFARIGEETDTETQNKQIAQNENILNQNLQNLYQELEEMKDFLVSIQGG